MRNHARIDIGTAAVAASLAAASALAGWIVAKSDASAQDAAMPLAAAVSGLRTCGTAAARGEAAGPPAQTAALPDAARYMHLRALLTAR